MRQDRDINALTAEEKAKKSISRQMLAEETAKAAKLEIKRKIEEEAEEFQKDIAIRETAEELAGAEANVDLNIKAEQGIKVLTETERSRQEQEKEANEMLEKQKEHQEKVEAQNRLKAARAQKDALVKKTIIGEVKSSIISEFIPFAFVFKKKKEPLDILNTVPGLSVAKNSFKLIKII